VEMMEKSLDFGLESRGNKKLLSLPATFAAFIDPDVPVTPEDDAVIPAIVKCKRFVYSCRSLGRALVRLIALEQERLLQGSSAARTSHTGLHQLRLGGQSWRFLRLQSHASNSDLLQIWADGGQASQTGRLRWLASSEVLTPRPPRDTNVSGGIGTNMDTTCAADEAHVQLLKTAADPLTVLSSTAHDAQSPKRRIRSEPC